MINIIPRYSVKKRALHLIDINWQHRIKNPEQKNFNRRKMMMMLEIQSAQYKLFLHGSSILWK